MSDTMLNYEAARRNYRIVVTILMLSLIIGSLAVANVQGSNRYPYGLNWLGKYTVVHGWPWTFVERDGPDANTPTNSTWPFNDTPMVALNRIALIADIAVALLILTCSGIIIYGFIPHQFTVRSLLLFTSAVGAILATIIHLSAVEWHKLIWIPIGLGLVSIVLTVLRSVPLLVRFVRRLLGDPQRRQHAEV